jgi:hypothetical protein
MKQIEGKIFIIGRRWFDAVNGNTYHSATVYVNGVRLHGRRYGYGNQYIVTAQELLINSEYDVPAKFSDFLNLESVVHEVAEVRRKKDL